MNRDAQLGDVLADPSANWSQVREAMKSQTLACTNAAIITAIVSERDDGTLAADAHDNVLDVSDVSAKSALSTEEIDKIMARKAAQGGVGEEVVDTQVPIKDAAPEHTVQDGSPNSRKKNRRRRLGNGSSLRCSSKNSLRRSQQRHSQQQRRSGASSFRRSSLEASINIMDFGVDQLNTLDESTASFDDRMMNSANISNDDRRASYSDDEGFVGWNNDSDSNMHSSVQSSCFSVDSVGFMGWGKDSEPEQDTALDLKDDQHIDQSKGPTSASMGEEWNIEDYENPEDNEVSSSSRRTSTTPSKGFFCNTFKFVQY